MLALGSARYETTITARVSKESNLAELFLGDSSRNRRGSSDRGGGDYPYNEIESANMSMYVCRSNLNKPVSI